MKRILRDYAILILLAGPIIALDQWTKMIIRNNIPVGGTWMPWEWLAPYARIVHWHNTGAAFGMFQGASLVFTILAFIVSGLIIYYFPHIPTSDRILRLALGMQLAGAVGNLIDRLTIGRVTDFISLGTFPVFNVADSSITIGTAVLILGTWLKERQEKRAAARAATEEPVQESATSAEEHSSDG